MSTMLQTLGSLTAGLQGAPLHSCMSGCLVAVHCLLVRHAVPDARQQAAWGRLPSSLCNESGGCQT